jgi:hypothetical protein
VLSFVDFDGVIPCVAACRMHRNSAQECTEILIFSLETHSATSCWVFMNFGGGNLNDFMFFSFSYPVDIPSVS